MTFPRVKGQRRAAKILSGFLATQRIPSAMLFAGLEGVGKTLMAHEFAKALLCPRKSEGGSPCGLCPDCSSIDRKIHPDVKAVNALYQAALRDEEPAKQKTLRVETIRHLRRDMELQPMVGSWKVAVVEEAHALEIESANALLKILEEPPPQTLWILVSSQKERLPRTVLSRCFCVPFAPLSKETLTALLMEQGLAEERARGLAALAEGSAGRARELEQALDLKTLSEGPEALPKELYLARTQVELALFALSQELRLKHGEGRLDFDRVQRPLRELVELRQALRANADPRLVLTLAGLAAEGIS